MTDNEQTTAWCWTCGADLRDALPALLRPLWQAMTAHTEPDVMDADEVPPGISWHADSPELAERIAAGYIPRDNSKPPALPRHLWTAEERGRETQSDPVLESLHGLDTTRLLTVVGRCLELLDEGQVTAVGAAIELRRTDEQAAA